jgi:transposase-like protein
MTAGSSGTRPLYLALDITGEGTREVLGMWVADKRASELP